MADDIVVTAMGPLGHIYVPIPLDDSERDDYAQRLVGREQVPLVIYATDDGIVRARNSRGAWSLPEDVMAVFGERHPFLHEVVDDLKLLTQHPDAGDLIISGWNPELQPMTFVSENGAHGSIGTEETRGFALLPTELQLQPRQHGGEAYIRGEDLYRAAFHFLHPKEPVPEPETGEDTLIHPVVDSVRLRVMTYNVHSCIGMDGRARPKRIARVIQGCNADLIALQEVDVNRSRTRGDDQAHRIAEMLGMHHAYYAVFDEDTERYGLAILSRYPIDHQRSGHLTSADSTKRREARGAMWVTVQTPMGPVHVLNTHFGLRRQERERQIRELLSDEWLGAVPENEPVILCGDLNAGPKSSVCRALSETLNCVQHSLTGHRPKKTFLSVWPVRQLDHIFVSSHFSVESIAQPRDPDSRVASDHLPICAELSYADNVDGLKQPIVRNKERDAVVHSPMQQVTSESGSAK